MERCPCSRCNAYHTLQAFSSGGLFLRSVAHRYGCTMSLLDLGPITKSAVLYLVLASKEVSRLGKCISREHSASYVEAVYEFLLYMSPR